MADVILYTDGACSGNPGPGGWGFIMVHPASGKELARSGGEPLTTNNRMELMAVIEGLSALKRPCCVEVVSDSSYVLNGLSSWMASWKKNGWRRREGKSWKEVKNVDLWQRLDGLMQIYDLKFTKIKGHAGHPQNEECDRMAVEESRRFLQS